MSGRFTPRAARFLLTGLLLGAGLGACSSGDAPWGPAPPAPPPADHTVFTHRFPGGRADTATGDFHTLAVRYPPIPVDGKYRHVLCFRMSPFAPPSRSPIPSHGPLILIGDDLEVIVFSPLDHFFVSQVLWEDGRIVYGIEGDVEEIPPGFTHSFLLVEGRGVNAVVERWGELMREHHGRERTDRYADLGAATLGYWTDNGAYYYYNTEPGMNEQETLLAVKADADARGIPYGYMQLDSWWYFKEEERGGGLVLWEPQPWMFPGGLAPFREALGLPLVAHNRWFAARNDYQDRYPFLPAGPGPRSMSFPLGRGVFDEFMDNAASWGIFTYEQDWLDSQYWGVPYLRSGVDHAERWMDWINDAAADRGLSVQLCMAGPAHYLYALDMPAVTTVRTSVDYIPGTPKVLYWPQFFQVNMIAWAVGALPFKDNFQTSPGQRAVLSETMGEQEALISALSAGMVGPGDRLGWSDAGLLGRTCRADGLLLKPDRPVTPIDAMFLPHERPHIVTTCSRRPGLGTWTYLAAFPLARGDGAERVLDELAGLVVYGRSVADMFVFPEAIRDWGVDLERDLGLQGPAVLYDWKAGTAAVVDRAFSVPPMESREEFAYYVIAPLLPNGLALIGETAKFVTLADRRFAGVEPLADALRVTVAGVPGERVALTAFDARAGRLLAPVEVAIGPAGQAAAELAR